MPPVLRDHRNLSPEQLAHTLPSMIRQPFTWIYIVCSLLLVFSSFLNILHTMHLSNSAHADQTLAFDYEPNDCLE